MTGGAQAIAIVALLGAGPHLVPASVLDPDRATFAGMEKARRPASTETLWLGLPGAEPRAPTSSIVVLRLPSDGHIRIAGGRFAMGSTPSEMVRAVKLCEREPFGVRCGRPGDEVGPWIRAEGYVHEVTLSEFELDRTEVTVGSYARCVLAGACSPPSYPPGDVRYDRPSLPVTHVRWEDARAFCSWRGGRLPTEAEWELAAKGHHNRMFPWGDLYNPHLANHGSWADDPSDGRDGFLGLAPVASFPDGQTPSGLHDMAGNAAEWVSDFYDRDDDGYGYPREARVNPKGPTSSPYGHVVRGGSYRMAAYWLRTAARFASSNASREIGFRCAYDVAAATGKP